MVKIARVFFDVDMRCAFNGLHSIMRKAKVEPDLSDGYVIFFNRKHTKFKLLSGQYLTYYDNRSKKIPLTAIQYLPAAFGGSDLDLERAMSKAIVKDVEKQLGVSVRG